MSGLSNDPATGVSETAEVTAPTAPPSLHAPESYFNRELSWLGFARRVLALVENPDVPLLERVKFAGITGMLHDEFFMKRISGLKRQMRRSSTKLSLDGRRPEEEFQACRAVLLEQAERLAGAIEHDLRPALAREGFPLLDHANLDEPQRMALRRYFRDSVLPILTPLAVDPEHPFPFISNLGLNLAAVFGEPASEGERIVRIKVPNNVPRWTAVPQGGFVPLEQVIAANLDLLDPTVPLRGVHMFRVTRGAEGDVDRTAELGEEASEEPGSIIEQVSRELKARRFAGVVSLQLDASAPAQFREWLAHQLGVSDSDVYPTTGFLGPSDLTQLKLAGREDLRYAAHEAVAHPRLARLEPGDPAAIFAEIARGDVLLHHPYHSFDSSVLRLIESAAQDPAVLAIKLTIYRTSSDSPIVRALAEAARRGKQVAVLVEVTARFDEAPNIAWGKFLEREGVHVAYGVKRLKTHVKLALVVRDEGTRVRRYAHVSTGNYHTGTARLYEDLGVLTAHDEICSDVAAVFNQLTGAIPSTEHSRVIVAPGSMRERFNALIRREAEHALAGRPSGIDAKMNQLQDPEIIRELYQASQAGVPIRLNVRGLCCLRPGVPGLSETIRVASVVGRFLEHGRVYRFHNAGEPEYYIGSADWMKRNLSNRVESVMPILDATLQRELDRMFAVYEADNCSAWDCRPDGVYVLRAPADGEPRRAAQETFIRLAREAEAGTVTGLDAAEGPLH